MIPRLSSPSNRSQIHPLHITQWCCETKMGWTWMCCLFCMNQTRHYLILLNSLVKLLIMKDVSFDEMTKKHCVTSFTIKNEPISAFSMPKRTQPLFCDQSVRLWLVMQKYFKKSLKLLKEILGFVQWNSPLQYKKKKLKLKTQTLHHCRTLKKKLAWSLAILFAALFHIFLMAYFCSTYNTYIYRAFCLYSLPFCCYFCKFLGSWKQQNWWELVERPVCLRPHDAVFHLSQCQQQVPQKHKMCCTFHNSWVQFWEKKTKLKIYTSGRWAYLSEVLEPWKISERTVDLGNKTRNKWAALRNKPHSNAERWKTLRAAVWWIASFHTYWKDPDA